MCVSTVHQLHRFTSCVFVRRRLSSSSAVPQTDDRGFFFPPGTQSSPSVHYSHSVTALFYLKCTSQCISVPVGGAVAPPQSHMLRQSHHTWHLNPTFLLPDWRLLLFISLQLYPSTTCSSPTSSSPSSLSDLLVRVSCYYNNQRGFNSRWGQKPTQNPLVCQLSYSLRNRFFSSSTELMKTILPPIRSQLCPHRAELQVRHGDTKKKTRHSSILDALTLFFSSVGSSRSLCGPPPQTDLYSPRALLDAALQSTGEGVPCWSDLWHGNNPDPARARQFGLSGPSGRAPGTQVRQDLWPLTFDPTADLTSQTVNPVVDPRMVNYPLGLGSSRINILVTDDSDPEPEVLTVYTVHVSRENRPSLPMFSDHVTCSFLQVDDVCFQAKQHSISVHRHVHLLLAGSQT